MSLQGLYFLQILKHNCICSISVQFRYFNIDLTNRRKNLNGAVLKSFHDEASLIPSYFEEKSPTEFSGISGTIVTQLMKEYNFTVDFLEYPGGYSNMVSKLAKFEIDFIAGQITHTKQRIDLANPGLTLEKSTVGLIFWKSENESTSFSSILLAFDRYVWISIGFFLLTIYTIIQMCLIIDSNQQSKINRIILGGVAITKAMFGNSLDESTFFRNKLGKTSSILVLTLSMTGFLLFTSYTSVFTSVLAIKELKIPFQSLTELAALSEFKLRTFPQGSTKTDIQKKAEGNTDITRAINDFIKPHYAYVGATIEDHSAWLIQNKGPNVGLLYEKDVYNSIVTS